MSEWTPSSLRPPTLNDGPFYAMDFEMVVAGDAEIRSLPKTTPRFERLERRFPHLPLRTELNRLCGEYNEEVLSALAAELRARLSGLVVKGRPSSACSEPSPMLGEGSGRPPWRNGQFANAVRKYSALALADEIATICCTLPAEPLAALVDALRATVTGHIRRGRRRIQGRSGPVASIRGAVQVRRLRKLPEGQIAREIENALPTGLSNEARRKRAYREVAAVPKSASQGVKVSYAIALGWWATIRAERQLLAAVRRGVLTESEAVQKREIRKSRFMSRASSTNTG